MPTPLLPAVPTPREIKLKSVRRTKRSQSESGKILTATRGGQYYTVTLVYPPMRPDQFGTILAFLESMEGRHGVFYVALDQPTGEAGEVVGNFVNFDNDSKLHRITATGPTVVYPAARVLGGNIVTSPIYMRASLAGDVQDMSQGRDGLVRFEIDLIERL